MLTAVKKKLFTVDDYYAMAHAGILGEDDRVELIEGEVIQMAPIGSRHQAVVDRLNRLFVSRVGDRAIVRVQGPLRLAPITEPQPDLQLLAPRDDFYAAAHPSQYEALLVVEVADTSLRFDRGPEGGDLCPARCARAVDRRRGRRAHPGAARAVRGRVRRVVGGHER